ncbi:MAG: RNA polymerase sigma-54 factor, partial [Pseudomonadota bacterium]
MSFSAKLEMRQGQQLVMTPQLQQAIRLLQLSNIELTAFVEAELERNPLLERDERDDAPDERAPNSDEATNAADAENWLDLSKGTGDATQALDTEVDNVYP